MFCFSRSWFLVMIHVLAILLEQGNGGNHHDKNVPFHLHDHGRMVEFQSIPALEGISFPLYMLDYDYDYLGVHDPKGCLPRLFLQRHLYIVSIYPLEFFDKTQEYITFFNCSSLGTRYLRNEAISMFAQDMFSCPIYAVSSDDSMLGWDVTFCTKMFELVSPVSAYSLQQNVLPFKLPKPKSDVGGKHKNSKIPEIILPGACDSL